MNRDTKYSIGIRSEVDKIDYKSTRPINGAQQLEKKAKDNKSTERSISLSENSENNSSFDSFNN